MASDEVSDEPGDLVAVTVTGSTWKGVSSRVTVTSAAAGMTTTRTLAANPTRRATSVYLPAGTPLKWNVPSAAVTVPRRSSARLTTTLGIGVPAESTTRPPSVSSLATLCERGQPSTWYSEREFDELGAARAGPVTETAPVVRRIIGAMRRIDYSFV